ncbi:MAG: hypothetical protein MAGBODY4_00615 [Candidatus Marinimicrobia bacterium]|nr:hypothetical protein [Candidatus Neomarinimicrobiota bacterium]
MLPAATFSCENSVFVVIVHQRIIAVIFGSHNHSNVVLAERKALLMKRFVPVVKDRVAPTKTNCILIIIGIVLFQACTGGELVQRSKIIYPVNASLESGRPDPPGTLSLGFTGGAPLDEYANRFQLRQYSDEDTTRLFKYYPDYYASFRMQYAYKENYSPTLRVFASFPYNKPMETDTLLPHITEDYRTLFGLEFGIPVYVETSSQLSQAFRIGFRFYEEAAIIKRTKYFNESEYTTSESKKMIFKMPVEYILNYRITPSMELIGGLNLNTLFFENNEGTGLDLLSYKAGIASHTSPNVRLTLWAYYNGKQTVMYDEVDEKATERVDTSPYLALQFAYQFSMGDGTD